MMSIVHDGLSSYAVHSVLSSSPVYSAGVPNSCDVPNFSASYTTPVVLASFAVHNVSASSAVHSPGVQASSSVPGVLVSSAVLNMLASSAVHSILCSYFVQSLGVRVSSASSRELVLLSPVCFLFLLSTMLLQVLVSTVQVCELVILSCYFRYFYFPCVSKFCCPQCFS